MGRDSRNARARAKVSDEALRRGARAVDKIEHGRAAVRHARRRARQRYGVDIDAAGQRRIVAAIRDGKSTFVRRGAGPCSIHDVELDGVVVRVVYDKRLKTITTCLPPEA